MFIITVWVEIGLDNGFVKARLNFVSINNQPLNFWRLACSNSRPTGPIFSVRDLTVKCSAYCISRTGLDVPPDGKMFSFKSILLVSCFADVNVLLRTSFKPTSIVPLPYKGEVLTMHCWQFHTNTTLHLKSKKQSYLKHASFHLKRERKIQFRGWTCSLFISCLVGLLNGPSCVVRIVKMDSTSHD